MFKKISIVMGGVILLLVVGASITKLSVHDLVSVDQQLENNILHLAYEYYDNPLERILIMFGKGRITSVNPPSNAEVQFFTLFRIPLEILRGQPSAKLEISLNPTNPYDETEKIEKAKEAVREFMGNQNMDLVYSSFSYNPSNFFVGVVSSQNTEFRAMRGSREWMRPVYIFQEKRFINNDCQVYGYEVNAETFQVIQVQTVWPQWFQAEDKNECPDVYSQPAKDKEEVEKAVFDILKKDPKYTSNILVRSDIQQKFQELKYSYSWIWEDESVSLPEGLIGDPFQHPVIRIIMTKDGRLDYYLNTTDLFKK
jgi:hypothetical protein